MSIIATTPVPAHALLSTLDTDQFPIVRPGCPAWCTDHRTMAPLVDGDRLTVTHYSAEHVVEATITDLGGTVMETHEISLDIMAVDDADPVIYLGVDGDCPMTAATARELAAALVALAGQIDGVR